MALITSAASGNFNAGATWTGGIVPTVGDEARASNGHTITITANATCDEVSNAGTGIFTLNDGVTLTANVTSKSTTASRNCLQFTAASPASANIVGNVTGGTVSESRGVINSSSGTLTINGNLLGGSGSTGGPSGVGSSAAANTSSGILNVTGNVTGGSNALAQGAVNSLNGTINITGNVTGGSVAGNPCSGASNLSTGTINITGNVNAGTSSGAAGAQNFSSGIINITGNVLGSASAPGSLNSSTGLITITGNSTGGTAASIFGSNNASTGTLTITGMATGGTGSAAAGASNASTGLINLGRAKGNAFGPGNSGGISASVGASNVGLGIIEIQELEYGDFGMSPTSGTGIRLKKVSTNQVTFNYVDSGAAKTLVDATQGQMPAASDVRSGVSYASGALTGTCRVPAAASVAFGVQVDATTGTAFLSQSDVLAAVWGAATSSLTTSGSIGERLKNAATVATTGEQLATALTAP